MNVCLILFRFTVFGYLLSLISEVNGLKRWYYTGITKNSSITSNYFHESIINLDSLYPSFQYVGNRIDLNCTNNPYYESDAWYVFSGQILVQYDCSYCHHQNLTEIMESTSQEDGNHEILELDILSNIEIEYMKQYIPSSSMIYVGGVIIYTQTIGIDYANNDNYSRSESNDEINVPIDGFMKISYPYMVEIGLLDHNKNQYETKEFIIQPIGRLVCIVLLERTVEFSQEYPANSIVVHRFILTTDPRGNYIGLVMHTWNRLENLQIDYNINKTDTKDHDNDNTRRDRIDEIRLKILTYNIWHNNPPAWKFKDPYDRWRRYERRLRYLSEIISNEDPDIILLQEVRVDNLFTARWKSKSDKAESRDSIPLPWEYGCQIDHILTYLQENRVESSAHGNITFDRGYHIVYHPGMLQFDRMSPRYNERIEEGVAILSRNPIHQTNVLLLPRHFNDSKDDHQRIVLSATVTFRMNNIDHTQIIPIDVFTSHFSLSEDARMKSVEAIQRFSCSTSLLSNTILDSSHYISIQSNPSTTPTESTPIISNPQIFGGDFNSEISEMALRRLIGNRDECHDKLYHSSHPIDFPSSDYNSKPFQHVENYTMNDLDSWLDVWCNVHSKDNMHRINHTKFMEKKIENIRNGFTFPSHIPIKRIDFLLVKNSNRMLKRIEFTAISSYIIGKVPLEPLIGEESKEEVWELDVEGNSHRTMSNTIMMEGDKEPDLLDPNGPVWASDHYGLVAVLGWKYLHSKATDD